MSFQLKAQYDQLFQGAYASLSHRWMAVDFFARVLFAQDTITPQYYPGSGETLLDIPGLPEGESYEGINSIAGHAVVWKGSTIKWCSDGDFTSWIPVASTITFGISKTRFGFVQPEVGETSETIDLLSDISLFTGQFVRVDSNINNPEQYRTNYYTVDEFISGSLILGETIASDIITVLPSATEDIFLVQDVTAAEYSYLEIDSEPTDLFVDRVYTSTILPMTLASFSVPAVGASGISVNVTSGDTSQLLIGDYLSIGLVDGTGQHIFQIQSLASSSVFLINTGLGTDTYSVGATVPSGNKAVAQPALRVTNQGTNTYSVNVSLPVRVLHRVSLIPLDLTGSAPVGSIVDADSYIETINTNDAGEIINVGENINGDVLGIVSLGDYGYILKNNSIQSMQYTGTPGAAFYFRPEILGEGPIGRYAWGRIHSRGIFIIGKKDMFEYYGGNDIRPVGEMHKNDFYKELDWSRVDEIIVHHNEKQQEVWVVYPSNENLDLKILIYNYEFKTVTIDTYDNELGHITAVGKLDWEISPAWFDVAEGVQWQYGGISALIIGDTFVVGGTVGAVDPEAFAEQTWEEVSEQDDRRRTLMAIESDTPNPEYGEIATSVNRVLYHGRAYSRASSNDLVPEGYTSLWETPDFDMEDSARFKQLDTIPISFSTHNRGNLDRPLFLYVQAGARDAADADIRWTDPVKIMVSGNANFSSKVNLRKTGRYLRLRFYSEDPEVYWEISGYKLIGRLSGTH